MAKRREEIQAQREEQAKRDEEKFIEAQRREQQERDEYRQREMERLERVSKFCCLGHS